MGYGGGAFYNEQKLKDAKLATPKTPDEWLAAMKATTDASKGNFGLARHHRRTPEHGRRDGELGHRFGRRLAQRRQVQLHRPGRGESRRRMAQSVGYAPKGTNSAPRGSCSRRQGDFLRDGPWVWGVLAKSPADVRPNLKIGALPFAVTPGGASNSLHLAAKTDAKKGGAWNFSRWQLARVAKPLCADRFAGRAQGRTEACRPGREPAPQGDQRRGRQAQISSRKCRRCARATTISRRWSRVPRCA